MQEYASKEKTVPATQLNRCIKSLSEAIGKHVEDLSGKISDSQRSHREDNSVGKKGWVLFETNIMARLMTKRCLR